MPARTPDGESLFHHACATCHLGRGALLGVEAPPLLLSEPLRYGDTGEAMRRSIRSGTGGAFMPAFADALTAAEIDAIVAYVRSRRAQAVAPAPR